jgi:hypothetical protein
MWEFWGRCIGGGIIKTKTGSLASEPADAVS